MDKQVFTQLLVNENLIENVKKKIIEKCLKKFVCITEDAVLLGIRLFLLERMSDISPSNKEEYVKKLVEFSSAKLLDRNSSLLKCINMEACYKKYLINIEKAKTKFEGITSEKAKYFTRKILHTENISKKDMDNLFDNLTSDIILSSMIGSIKNQKVVNETRNALRSVMSRQDIMNFIYLLKHQKANVLKSIRNVVCGIRVFNFYAYHYGEGITDITLNMISKLKTTKTNIKEILLNIEKEIRNITHVMKHMFIVDSENDCIIYNYPGAERDFIILKEILILKYNAEQKILDLLNTLKSIKRTTSLETHHFKGIYNELYKNMVNRSTIPTEEIFPFFDGLAERWRLLHAMMFVLQEFKIIKQRILKIAENYIDYEAMSNLILSKKEAVIKEPEYEFHPLTNPLCLKSKDCQIIDATPELNGKSYIKVCTYYLIAGDGLLIPSNTELGIVSYKNYYFAFSSSKYMNIFLNNLDINIKKYFKIIKNFPHIIILFKDHKEFTNIISSDEPITIIQKPIENNEAGVQTELHPIPRNKDINYTWNVWELRKRAIQLANIKNMKTHSSQTNISYFRFSNSIQTIDLADHCIQTYSTKSV